MTLHHKLIIILLFCSTSIISQVQLIEDFWNEKSNSYNIESDYFIVDTSIYFTFSNPSGWHDQLNKSVSSTETDSVLYKYLNKNGFVSTNTILGTQIKHFMSVGLIPFCGP